MKIPEATQPAVIAAVVSIIVNVFFAGWNAIESREATARLESIKVALEGAETPNDIGRRLRLVYQVYPDLRDELAIFLPKGQGSGGVQDVNPLEYSSLFGNDAEARLMVFHAMAGSASCGAEVAAAWEALFAPDAPKGGTEGMQWASGLKDKIAGHCPT